MGLLSSIVKAVYKPIDIAVTTFAHPVQVANAILSKDKKVSDVVAQTIAQPKSKQITDVLLAGATYATGLGVAKSVATKGVASVAKAIVPASTKGKVAAAVIAPVAIGAAVSQPAKTINAVTSAPKSLANFGGNAANLIASPSVSNLKTLVKENPVISTAAGVAAVAAVGGGVGLAANTLATFTNTKATKENTGMPTDSAASPTPIMLPTPQTTTTAATPAAPNNNTALTPVTPQTKIVTTNTRNAVSRYKKRKQTQNNVSQRVNIKINNVGTRNTNYLKRSVV